MYRKKKQTINGFILIIIENLKFSSKYEELRIDIHEYDKKKNSQNIFCH